MTALIVYASLALAVSFLCSLLEAALLSIPPSHVGALVERGSWAGRQLDALKAQIDRPLAAILTLNTVAHTVGAAGVGAEATVLWGHGAFGAASAVMTVLILFLSEIVPKTLGAVYAKPMAAFTAAATRAMMVVAFPPVICIAWLSRILGGGRSEAALSRAEIRAALQIARGSGSLSREEYGILANLMSLGSITLDQILTPRTVVFALPAELTVSRVFDEHKTLRFTRIPIYRESVDHVSGYVIRYDLERAHRTGGEDAVLSELARPIRTLPEQASAAAALEMMLREQEHIAVVVDEFGGMEGILTLEDVLESLLGSEIVDEKDTAVDLQEVARRIAARRNAGMRRPD